MSRDETKDWDVFCGEGRALSVSGDFVVRLRSEGGGVWTDSTCAVRCVGVNSLSVKGISKVRLGGGGVVKLQSTPFKKSSLLLASKRSAESTVEGISKDRETSVSEMSGIWRRLRFDIGGGIVGVMLVGRRVVVVVE